MPAPTAAKGHADPLVRMVMRKGKRKIQHRSAPPPFTSQEYQHFPTKDDNEGYSNEPPPTTDHGREEQVDGEEQRLPSDGRKGLEAMCKQEWRESPQGANAPRKQQTYRQGGDGRGKDFSRINTHDNQRWI